MKPNQRPKQKQNPCSGGRTIWVGHLLHSSGGDHDGHGDLEPQHGGGHVDLGHVDQYTRTEPLQRKKKEEESGEQLRGSEAECIRTKEALQIRLSVREYKK
jgi:hypothetical protein